MDRQEWQEYCLSAVSKLKEHIEKYITPISKVVQEDESQYGIHWGSASYLEYAEQKFAITNEHVAKGLTSNSLAHTFYEHENVYRFKNPFCAIGAPTDVAISKIGEEIWCDVPHKSEPIPKEMFAATHSPIQGEGLFFFGYSGEKSKFYYGSLFSVGTPYLTQECVFPKNVVGADINKHFSLHYPPDLTVSEDPKSNLPDPHGFSGSLVWNTKIVECLEAGIKWDPSMAKVTGIVWGWPSSAGCILATKVEHMQLQFLLDNYDECIK